MVIEEIRRATERHHEVFLCHRFACRLYQAADKTEFGSSQRKYFACRGLKRPGVAVKAPAWLAFVRGGIFSGQFPGFTYPSPDDINGSGDFPQVDRFDQIGVGTDPQAGQTFVERSARADDDYAVLVHGSQVFRHFQTVFTRQPQVEQDDIGGTYCHYSVKNLGAFCSPAQITARTEKAHDIVAQVGFVFDYGYTGFGLRFHVHYDCRYFDFGQALTLMFSRYAIAAAILLFSTLAWASPGRWAMGVDAPLAALEDRDGSLTVEQVASMPDTAFRPLSAGLSVGYTKSAYWLKFSPPTQVANELLLELSPSYVDEIILFEPTGNGWRKRVSGDRQPYAEREIGYRNFVFRLPPSDAGKTLFLRVHSTSVLAVRGIFWEPTAFTDAVIPESIIVGAYFGIFGLSALLALAYAIWLRSRPFFAYTLLAGVAMMAIASLNGIHAQLLFPRSPAMADATTGVFVLLLHACVIWFSTVLLETAIYFPRFHRLMLTVALVMAVSSISAFSDYYRWFVAVLNPISSLLQASGAVLAMLLARRKILGARIFAVAYTLHAAAILPVVLLLFGVLPPNIITLYGWQAETLIHVLLLHSAMLWRVRKNEEEHFRVQKQALAASLEAERQLETRVSERTQALTDAQRRLEAALVSEQRTLLEQRQFMSMVSHEFRTPLAIIDSVAINLTEVPSTTVRIQRHVANNSVVPRAVLHA